jgi:hypothetical protein
MAVMLNVTDSAGGFPSPCKMPVYNIKYWHIILDAASNRSITSLSHYLKTYLDNRFGSGADAKGLRIAFVGLNAVMAGDSRPKPDIGIVSIQIGHLASSWGHYCNQ